jgi:hypothetical protein
MLDTIGILFSTLMILTIVVRAVRLDRRQPWFQPIKPKEKPASKVTPVWRRQR